MPPPQCTRAKAAVEASRTSVHMHVTFQDYAVLPGMTAKSLDEFCRSRCSSFAGRGGGPPFILPQVLQC